MSTTQFGNHSTLVIPTQLDKSGLKKNHITENRSNGSSVDHGTTTVKHDPDACQRQGKLETVEAGTLSLSIVNQYNQLFEDKDEGLTCRSLPPVKLSVKMSKTKFVETTKGELTSRILKPQLTMKTHTAGHHVFTEGISKTSKIPKPTFALSQMKIPYSNLPDNIMIFKEKNQFAFGVKNDVEPSPYRLAPKLTEEKPFHLNLSLLDNSPRFEIKSMRPAMTERIGKQATRQYKSNKILLDPIICVPRGLESTWVDTSGSNPSVTNKAPLIANNTVDGTSNINTTLRRRNSHAERGESRLSIVSIGDTVTPEHFDRNKKQTRRLYPMYNYRIRRDEFLKMSRFGGTFYSSISTTKPDASPTGFTYKISSQHLDISQTDGFDVMSPIKNNLQNRQCPLINAPRGLGGYKRYAKGGTDFSGELSYQENKLRRFYNRRQYNSLNQPRSAGSNNSADLYMYPVNPPPSETSLFLSEDVTHNLNEFRKDIVPLVEEKEKTVSNLSPTRSFGKGTRRASINESGFENVVGVIDDDLVETGRSLETDTDIQMDTVINTIIDERKNADAPVLSNVSDNNNSSETKLTHLNEELKHDKIKEDASTKEVSSTVVNTSSNAKACLPQQKSVMAVPTFTFEKLSNQPVSKEKTSLSRNIQNMLISDKKSTKQDQIFNESVYDQDMKASCSVTRLRLFSENSTDTNFSTSVSVIKEHREIPHVDNNDDGKDTNINVEKKRITNANIEFISPLIQDNKAKRQ